MATDYLEGALLEYLYRNVALSPPASLYFGLFKADPTDTGDLSQEVSGGSYARVAITRNTTNFAANSTAGSAKRTSNAVAITFPAPTADWGTVTHWAILDSATLGAGNMWNAAALAASRTILNGDNPPSFAIGSITIDAT